MQRSSSLKEWLTYIQSINPISIDLGLERVKSVAIALGLLPFEIYTILIGGTNGKGSTCFLLEKILLNNKIRVGLYTSPHLLSYHERIRVCGQKLSDNIHIQAMSVIEKTRNNIALTYFEFITLSALYIFKQFKLDLVILEVGMGGRLDATNIVNPDISVITNVAMDHLDLLGTTRDKIALEKVGIFRSYKPAIIGEKHYPTVIDYIAKSKKVKLFTKGRNWDFFCYKDQWNWIDYTHHSSSLMNLPIPCIPLANAAIVLSILRWIPFVISRSSIYYSLQKIFVLGRFQIIYYKPLIILDVGHNPHAAIYIVTKLSTMISDASTVRVVIGMLYNKDIKSTIFCLSSLVNIWYFTELDTPLSATIHQFLKCSIVKNINAKFFDNIISAWKQAILDSNTQDCILVFGSFYAISAILKLLMCYRQRYSLIDNIF